MKTTLYALLQLMTTLIRSRLSLQLEIVALRHQLAVYQRTAKRPQISSGDRLLWSWLSRRWPGWRGALVFVQPGTVIAWQRKRFRDHWANLTRHDKIGRPPVPKEIRELVSIDFIVVPTAKNKVLLVLVVLAHHRRRVVHFNVTEHPTAQWTAQQIVEAFSWDSAPKYLLRDRDAIYGSAFQKRVRSMGIEDAPRSPWQNSYVEGLIGSIRRDCLDHVVVLNEHHLKRILKSYFSYYHRWRTHLPLKMDSPDSRSVQSAALGKVVSFPEVDGLHHHYERLAA